MGIASPSGSRPVSGDGAAHRQSSTVARNVHFPLDEGAGFQEDQSAKTLITPALPDERPAPKAGCFVSRLDSPGANHLRDVPFRPVKSGKSNSASQALQSCWHELAQPS